MKKSLTALICYTIGLTSLGNAASNREKSSPVNKTEKATFAGGCFWCMQPPYDRLKGVISTIVGYTGGSKKDPTYEEVSEGGTEHAEPIEITYDPTQVIYQELLDLFWKNIDPTALNKQFCDIGTQYRSAIFYHNEEQKRLAETSKKKFEKSGHFGKRIFTEVVPASPFYMAEESDLLTYP